MRLVPEDVGARGGALGGRQICWNAPRSLTADLRVSNTPLTVRHARCPVRLCVRRCCGKVFGPAGFGVAAAAAVAGGETQGNV